VRRPPWSIRPLRGGAAARVCGLRAALAGGEKVTIVALGSLSTAGAGASSPLRNDRGLGG